MAPAPEAKIKAQPNPNSGVIWHFSSIDQQGKNLNNWKLPADQRMNRTIATCAIDPASGLLFIPDFSGLLHCLDAETGKRRPTLPRQCR